MLSPLQYLDNNDTIIFRGDKMAISDKKTRTMLTLEKTDKDKLQKLAKEQNRSLNNLIETILKEYLANR